MVDMISRFFAWLFGTPAGSPPPRPPRWKINGVGVEKILVFAKGREATVREMVGVSMDPRFEIQSFQGSRMGCSTEQWDPLPGETESATIQRIAHETADKFPGLFVIAFAWPDSSPTIIAAIVTETLYKPPFPVLKDDMARSKTS